ncbi:MAG: pilus assembly protein PilM [Phycisphaerales bacterium]|nr:pilus assembly protein PilM [Phycisphaerales bacterium]
MFPIGVDIGRTAVKLAQFRADASGKIVPRAYAILPIPPEIRGNVTERVRFLVSRLGRMFERGRFQSRNCVLSLPPTEMFVRHLRVPKREGAAQQVAIRQAIASELTLPLDEVLLRHLVVGEVYEGGELCQEVLVVAVPMMMFRVYLDVFTRLGLRVEAITIEPVALARCFTVLHHRPEHCATVYLDLGASGTKVTIAKGDNVLFHRLLKGGSEGLDYAVSQATRIAQQEVHLLNMKPSGSALADEKKSMIEGEFKQWRSLWMTGIEREIGKSLRYFSSSFRNVPLDRVVFVGGQSRNQAICEELAKRLRLPAQLGNVGMMLQEVLGDWRDLARKSQSWIGKMKKTAGAGAQVYDILEEDYSMAVSSGLSLYALNPQEEGLHHE